MLQRGDFDSPALIRAAVGAPVKTRAPSSPARVRRVHDDVPLPGFLGTAVGSTSLITNWASFYTIDVALPGAEFLRHDPVFDPRMPSPLHAGAIVFRPRAGECEILSNTPVL